MSFRKKSWSQNSIPFRFFRERQEGSISLPTKKERGEFWHMQWRTWIVWIGCMDAKCLFLASSREQVHIRHQGFEGIFVVEFGQKSSSDGHQSCCGGHGRSRNVPSLSLLLPSIKLPNYNQERLPPLTTLIEQKSDIQNCKSQQKHPSIHYKTSTTPTGT